MASYGTLIEAAELKALGATGAHHVILDCRAVLGDAQAGSAAWAAGHIPGAVHANLETQLAAAPHSEPHNRGGRHPLPDRELFIAQCGNWGISPSTQVVAYDDAGGAYAARAWWLLRWLGHKQIAVLNGGLESWTALPDGVLLGASEKSTEPPPSPTEFIAREPLTRIASLAQVEVASRTSSGQAGQLIDARARERFDGHVEPIDPVAGHIPSAYCLPLTGNTDHAGHFLPAEQLARRFEAAGTTTDNLICYCGSGVTAAHNVLAICHAGLPEPRLYVGSWSEWSADPTRPIAQATPNG